MTSYDTKFDLHFLSTIQWSIIMFEKISFFHNEESSCSHFLINEISCINRLIERFTHSFCDEQLCIALCRFLKGACRRVDCGASATRWCGRWEKRRRWRRVSREVVDTFAPRAYIYTSYLSVRAGCTANDNQLVAPPNARASARARETCIPYFMSNTYRWDFNEALVADPRSSLPFLLFFPRMHLRQVRTFAKMLSRVCCEIALKITARETRSQNKLLYKLWKNIYIIIL